MPQGQTSSLLAGKEPLPVKTFRSVFGYTDLVLKRKPVIQPGQDLRDLPTYTIPEAAIFLGMAPRTLQYWYSNSLLDASGHVGDIALLSFRDLSEAYTLELLRTFYGFNPRTLRDVIRNFRRETRLRRPLLEADLVVVLGNLVLKKAARGKQPVRMVDLAHERNLVFPELVSMIGKRIVKDRDRNPNRIFPWRMASSDDHSNPVLLDPEILSGRLVVSGTRVPVAALAGLKSSGKSTHEIARFYELDAERVEKALQHIERPLRKKAA